MILLYVLTVHYQGKLHSLQDCLTNTSTSLDYATTGIRLVNSGKQRDTAKRQMLGVMK
jgi:hypothetical protein